MRYDRGTKNSGEDDGVISRIRSLGLNGIEGYEVFTECFITNGLPGFELVGLPDLAVKEARERVRAAVKNCGYKFPVSRITVNLAPAGTRKSGTLYDLPILLGILAASGSIRQPGQDCAFLGEVSLEGKLRPVSGVLPMALAARNLGIATLFVPAANAAEATLAEGITVYGVGTVQQIAAHLSGQTPLAPESPWQPRPECAPAPDFRDVKGQENAKRALEIAAAGGHNILLIGPPGSGKSMLARRLPSILPDLSREESLEVTKLYSVMGLLPQDDPLVQTRPFRSPHHTVSSAALAGGGPNPRPGEISLCHKGVLFLDELPEFRRDALEVLRQPLEDGRITVSRVLSSVTYPSEFMLVCAMNPCKCGWYGDPSGRCTCTQASVEQYRGRISGPLLDRIDLIVEVPAVPFEELSRRGTAEPSEAIRARVNAARDRQRARFGAHGAQCNARMAPEELRGCCELDEACRELLKAAFERLQMTARSYDRVRKVARTIADLDGSETIRPEHLAEAVQYRSFRFGNQ